MISRSKTNIAILASGLGTNALNIIEYVQNDLDGLNICLVISDRKDAPVLEKVREKGIPSFFIPYQKKEGETSQKAKLLHEMQMVQKLKEFEVQWVLLAGYMRILGPYFLDAFYNRHGNYSKVINIHPSLLPAFPGIDAYQKAYQAGVYIAGATIHLVDAGMDTGPVLMQKCFERKKQDSFEDFQKRGLEVEYSLYRDLLVILNNKDEQLIAERILSRSVR